MPIQRIAIYPKEPYSNYVLLTLRHSGSKILFSISIVVSNYRSRRKALSSSNKRTMGNGHIFALSTGYKGARMSKKPTTTKNLSLASPTDERLAALWRARDYTTLLAEPYLLTADIEVDGHPLSEWALELVRTCPDELQAQHPLQMLRIAYILFCAAKQREADALMQRIRTDIENKDEESERQILLGEWMFITALFCYPHIDKMLSALQKADEFCGGKITVMDADSPFLFLLTSPFAVFHITAGNAEKEGSLFKQFAMLYEKLTDGGGLGSAELYDAGLCYYRGDFTGAKLLCYKAAFLAETKRQIFIQMGAARLLAQIAIHDMDMDAFAKAMKMEERAAASSPRINSLTQKMLEFERSDLYLEANVADHTPEWVQEGNLTSFPAVTHRFFRLQQLRYFFYGNKHEQCIGLGEALIRDWPDCGVLLKATIGMYVAFSYLRLDHEEQGMDLFKQYFPTLFADKLYLVFSYFYENMDGVLDDYLLDNYPTDAEAVFKQIEQNSQGRLRFMRTYLDTSAALTEKEKMVAELAAQGLQNKEISKKMGISVSTVRTHLRQVFEKLEIDRRSQIEKLLK